ncbi:MAG: hypothetical protein QOI01_2193 [Mycobacterium sp.]|jgi:hypothetical protein|nr:hypothetical protein [Mycobacterium sp.]
MAHSWTLETHWPGTSEGLPAVRRFAGIGNTES